MIHFEFPNGLSFSYQIIAVKNGTWLIDLRSGGSVVEYTRATMLIDNTGVTNLIEKCQLESIYIYPQNRTDQFLMFGNLVFNNISTEFTTKFFIISDGEQVTVNNSRRRSPIKNGGSWNPLGEVNCVATVMTKKDPCTDYDIIVSSLIGNNTGIGFWQKDSGLKIINPDESKKWECACLSIDERTCLAVHETGGCILDNPFN